MVLLTRRQGRIACGINRRDSIRSRPTPAIKKKSNWPAGHQVIQSGKHLSNTGEVVQNTGGLLGKSGNVHFDSGKQVRNTGNVLFKSGEVVLNTGNIVGNTGNLLQDTGEVVEKTGDVLRNSGNVVRNTGKAVGNTGDLSRLFDLNGRCRGTGQVAGHADRILFVLGVKRCGFFVPGLPHCCRPDPGLLRAAPIAAGEYDGSCSQGGSRVGCR